MTTLIETIRESVIGHRQRLRTPFGEKPLIYADYTASGRALGFIEDFIRAEVLPYYANTHSETSATGARTTAFREQAREQIREAVNGTAEDRVIFCGSGATAAINRLLDIMNLRLPRDLAERYRLEERIPADEKPVVFIGPYEHHSNELPWRESIADVVVIALDSDGQIDAKLLEEKLREFQRRPLLIGSFSAASNVTGVKSDVPGLTALLKRYGALAFWDYAAAAPYTAIDMSAASPIDAVFISPHKFVGGPGTPGVLVAKKTLFGNSVPAVVGGGTVSYVSPDSHRYVEDHERREEGGTPAIVESIRAGLVFKLQREVGIAEIEKRESAYIQRAIARLQPSSGLEVLGSPRAERLAILSLRFKHGERDLHYGFVVSLLNDLFGIQARGGCSCAGPYGHSLLGMDSHYSKAIEREIEAGALVLRPGWVRLNFNYFIAEEEFQYLLRAIELIAEHGWRLLPWYHYDAHSGVWRYRASDGAEHSTATERPVTVRLDTLSLGDYASAPASQRRAVLSLDGMLERAEQELLRKRPEPESSTLYLSPAAERLRWFVLPQELVAEPGPTSTAEQDLEQRLSQPG